MMSLLPAQSSLIPSETHAPRVLVIEGGTIGVELRDALEQAGYEVSSCGDFESVSQVIQLVGVDLVVLEANTAGFELCGELRATEDGRQVPILLVCSEVPDEQLVTRGLLCGADDVVVAKGRMGELQARIRVQLRNKRDRDRLRRVRAEREQFRIEATIDPLTHVANRRTFDARIADACKGKDTAAVLFVDVDHFKRVNDELGHDVGDKVLQAIARTLDGACGVSDLCARYGGEEFAILARDADAKRALDLAEKVRASVADLSVHVLPRGAITVSVGVATFQGGDDPARWCRRADEALYEAKRGGRNRVVLAGKTTSGATSTTEARLLAQLASGRAGLPVLPEAAHEALRLAQDPSTDIGRIAKLVDGDPAIAARFVALAGSAVYSGRVKPTTTKAALIRIGLHASRDLLLQVVYERSSETLPAFSEEVAQSFQRSVRVAHACRQIAAMIAPDYDLAYLCGLLHDIGEARIYRILSRMPDAIALAPDKIASLVARHHARAGADVARAWNLPGDIVQACEEHHGPPSRAPLAARIVIAGDALERLSSQPTDEAPRAEELATLAQLGVAAEAAVALARAHQALMNDCGR